MKNSIIYGFLSVLFLLSAALFTSCNEDTPGKYQMTSGLPTVYFVRYQDKNLEEQLLTSATMGSPIVIIGDNLTSVQQVLFNDVPAILNINMITKNTLFVTVPNALPNVNTNKIYFVNANKDTLAYDFTVNIAPPVYSRIKCEWVPEGGNVVILGSSFYANDASNLKILVGDYLVPTADIVSFEPSQVVFKAPPAEISGPVEVRTLFGTTGRSKDIFRDSRGWITGFEDSENGGTGFVAGWGRPTRIENDPALSLMGKYVKLTAPLDPGSNPSFISGGNDMTINIWSRDNTSNPNSGIPNPMFPSDPKTSTLKFEVNVIQAWSSCPMIFAFDNANGNENYLWADGTQPRGFWVPWLLSGSYISDGWETVAIPLSEMIYNGSRVAVPAATEFGQLGISIHNRGYASYGGTACTPVILVDNIRVVP